ncbi:hypothetical protein M9X92_011884 [Pyricularia oryzae]|nr:hypothetical protein M9X92_011884 [Pyricularia oryzae]
MATFIPSNSNAVVFRSRFELRLSIKWLMFGGVIFPVVSFRKSLKSDGTLLHLRHYAMRRCAPQRHTPPPPPTTPSYFVIPYIFE